MDEISNEFKNWPDWIITLRITSPLLPQKSLFDFCHQRNSFSFDWIFLKLEDKVDMDEILDEFETGQIGSFIIELGSLDCGKGLCLTLSSA